ncbi:MAG: rod shape-determining protein MreC [Oscillospiraceae bacterium]|nr:rod shape-determining protein MreC [Oscillospiraceae bacterium]
MRRLFSNKIFIVILITLLVVVIIIMSTIPGNPIRTITAPVSFVIDPIQKGVKSVGEGITGFFSAVTEGMDIRKENEELKAEIAQLEYQVAQGEEAIRRWEELKDAFHIKDTFENYRIIGAPVLTREADEWFSVIRIDLGQNDGFLLLQDQSCAVVDARMNLIGRIMTSEPESSKVLPLLHEGFSVSAKVNTVNGAVVRVSGETTLKQDGLCKVTRIPVTIDLKVGDELVTSGQGGLFPAGIPIGVIISVDYSSELNRTAILQPYANLNDIKDVFVMVPEENSDTTADTEAVSVVSPR